jgi:predicted acyltransferase
VTLPPTRERLLSLDVFRGITVAGMLLVNNPGSWGAIYEPLEHAPWFGWTPTDLIFPFFLFIVGVTTYLSREARRARGESDGAIMRQTARRALTIVGVGLLMTGFPYHQFFVHLPGGAVFDSTTTPLDVSHWRFTGVLQRIGVCYLLSALLTMRTSARQQVWIVAVLLVGYWLALTLIPVPGHGMGALLLADPGASLAAWLDRTIIGPSHMWIGGGGIWDPEGILSTIPATATAVLGVLAGRWIADPRPLQERLTTLFAVGSLGMTAGLVWAWSFPIGKNLWTSSYVLFTAGMACVAIATCAWLVDIRGWRAWIRPFIPFGMNPIVAFVASGVLSRFLYTLVKVPRNGTLVSVQSAWFDSLFAPLFSDPRDASLLFALVYVAVFYAGLRLMHHRGIIVKV